MYFSLQDRRTAIARKCTVVVQHRAVIVWERTAIAFLCTVMTILYERAAIAQECKVIVL